MTNKIIIPEPTELFTSISLQNIGKGKSGELKPVLSILRVQHKTYCQDKELERIILNRILIESVKYN